MIIKFDKVGMERLPEIVQINYLIFKGMYEFEPYSSGHYREKLSGVEPIIYTARFNDGLVGDAISFRRDNSLYLWVLGVSKNFRNKGIASKLFDLTEKYARDNGFNSVTTKVYNVSEDMLRLVLKRGYCITKVEESDVDSKYDAIHLRLELT